MTTEQKRPMPVFFKRNSLMSMGGGQTGGKTRSPRVVHVLPSQSFTSDPSNTVVPSQPINNLVKRPAEPTEVEKLLLHKSQQQNVKLEERNRQQFYHMKVEAARRIQRAWRKYYANKGTRAFFKNINSMSKDNVRRKRLQATQDEWEKQIAALTIQLAWRKYYRRKLLRCLHPNRRQLLMWDPEVIALKQHALVNYIYNETIHAPFWHPTLKTPNRPLWFKFIPSAAAVSYNFAVDHYVPWVARVGAQPSFPDTYTDAPATIGGYPRPKSHPPSSYTESVRSSKSGSYATQDGERRQPPSKKSAQLATSSQKTS